MRALIKFPFILIMLFAVKYAFAGGDHWEFTIISYKKEADYYLLVMSPVKKPIWFAGDCSIIKIQARYKTVKDLTFFERLKRRSDVHTSKQEHEIALNYLGESHIKNSTINFGVMMSGLPNLDDDCQFVSNALVLYEDSGKKAVYAYY